MYLKKPKISLIGAGNIGGTLAHLIGIKGLGEVVLLDRNIGLAEGKALDISQALAVEGIDINIKGTNEYKDIENSDIIIVTAGLARKPGMSRDDLINSNNDIIKEVALNVKKYSSESFVIVVTNPLDIMVYTMFKESGLYPNKIVGMSGTLDSARFKMFLSEELKVSLENINAFVLGGHGDSMVPIIRYATVCGISIPELIKMGRITKERVDEIVNRTRQGGGEIVFLLKTGSAYYAPAAACIKIVESYLKDKKEILPCSAYLNDQYDLNGFFVGVPVIIGSNGVEEVIEVNLDDKEKEAFKSSAEEITNILTNLHNIKF